MLGLQKLVGAYLVALSVAVAVFFIVNTLLADSIDVLNVWYVLDVLMVIGLALGLAFGYARKRSECGGDPEGAVTRRYLEANVVFYAIAAVTILFLHNWFALLKNGGDSLDGNHQAWVIWAAVDVMLPLALGALGCRLWKESSSA